MTKTADAIDYTPPKVVQNACKKGLTLKDAYGGKGLREPTIEWAQHFADGNPSDAAHARKMRAWFARHDTDKRPGWDKPPTPGFVARLLWGGDAGQRWAQKLVKQAEKVDEAAKSAKKAKGGNKKADKPNASRKLAVKKKSR